jgi:predicted nucleic acid-binding protein
VTPLRGGMNEALPARYQHSEPSDQGKILAPLDLLIATHALSVGAVIVTNDRAFCQVADLSIEDWTV